MPILLEVSSVPRAPGAIVDLVSGVPPRAFAGLALPGDPFSVLSLVAGLFFAAGLILLPGAETAA